MHPQPPDPIATKLIHWLASPHSTGKIELGGQTLTPMGQIGQ
jgi:hypothetical protein